MELELRPFNIVAILKNAKRFKTEKEKLKQKLDNMPELPAVKNDSGIHGSGVSDLTGQTAVRRLEIEHKIEQIELYEEMLDFGIKSLTEDERALVRGFYFGNKRVGQFVRQYGRKHGICKDYVYDRKNKALGKMSRAILKEFYGEE